MFIYTYLFAPSASCLYRRIPRYFRPPILLGYHGTMSHCAGARFGKTSACPWYYEGRISFIPSFSMTSPGTFLVCNPMSFFRFCISHRPCQRLVPYLFNEPLYFDSSINIAQAHGGSVEVFGADLFIDHSFMPLRTIASTGRRLELNHSKSTIKIGGSIWRLQSTTRVNIMAWVIVVVLPCPRIAYWISKGSELGGIWLGELLYLLKKNAVFS